MSDKPTLKTKLEERLEKWHKDHKESKEKHLKMIAKALKDNKPK